jgi:hypothetical protein
VKSRRNLSSTDCAWSNAAFAFWISESSGSFPNKTAVASSTTFSCFPPGDRKRSEEPIHFRRSWFLTRRNVSQFGHRCSQGLVIGRLRLRIRNRLFSQHRWCCKLWTAAICSRMASEKSCAALTSASNVPAANTDVTRAKKTVRRKTGVITQIHYDGQSAVSQIKVRFPCLTSWNSRSSSRLRPGSRQHVSVHYPRAL